MNNWEWPQYTYLVIMCLSLLVSILNHGKPRDAYNAYAAFIGTIVAVFVLYNGGFFK